MIAMKKYQLRPSPRSAAAVQAQAVFASYSE